MPKFLILKMSPFTSHQQNKFPVWLPALTLQMYPHVWSSHYSILPRSFPFPLDKVLWCCSPETNIPPLMSMTISIERRTPKGEASENFNPGESEYYQPGGVHLYLSVSVSRAENSLPAYNNDWGEEKFEAHVLISPLEHAFLYGL